VALDVVYGNCDMIEEVLGACEELLTPPLEYEDEWRHRRRQIVKHEQHIIIVREDNMKFFRVKHDNLDAIFRNAILGV
jgi:hypothetical protein